MTLWQIFTFRHWFNSVGKELLAELRCHGCFVLCLEMRKGERDRLTQWDWSYIMLLEYAGNVCDLGKKLQLVFGLCACSCSGLEAGSLGAAYITESELLTLAICGAPSLMVFCFILFSSPIRYLVQLLGGVQYDFLPLFYLCLLFFPFAIIGLFVNLTALLIHRSEYD